MKLEKIEGSTNYCCTVINLPAKQAVPGLDNLVKVTIFGNDVLTKKDADEDQLYLFFPAECAISNEYLRANNEFREGTLNKDCAQKGYFEPSGRVKAVKFKGVISTGYIAPISSLADMFTNADYEGSYPGAKNFIYNLSVGAEFNSIDGFVVCKKYKVVRTQGTPGTKESRFNKKLKRFDKLVPNQFRFHESTSQLAKNLHQFNPDNIIVITDKFHGTSAVFSNVLIKRELSLRERVAKWFGIQVVDTKYDNLYSSRSVIKNQHINKEQGGGYYGEDIWAVVNKELEGKIEQGITIYGEIVGFLESGKYIQKGYDYSCSPSMSGNNTLIVASTTDIAEHKFLCYRITYTKPDGNVIEFNWQQIKDYCKKYSLETVKQLFYGTLYEWLSVHLERQCWGSVLTESGKENVWFPKLIEKYLEKDCKYCINKVKAEGIVVRIDGRNTYSAFKLKSKAFLLQESKQLDENIEDLESIS